MNIDNMAKDVDKLNVEGKIEFITLTTLGGLKGVFVDNNFDDKKATLSLYYFLNRFVKHAWKGHKPSDVLLNAIEVIKATDDSSLPTPKGGVLKQ